MASSKQAKTEAEPLTNASLQWWSVFFQVCTAFILLGSAIIAGVVWWTEHNKRRTDRTLEYINHLTERSFIDALWDIQEFPLCFEKMKRSHLSYVPFRESTSALNKSRSTELAKQWWAIIENETSLIEGCGKPIDAERNLMMVYGRLEALASCAISKVCSFEDAGK